MKRLYCGWIALLIIFTGGFALSVENAAMENVFDATEELGDVDRKPDVLEEGSPLREVGESVPGGDNPTVHWTFGVSMTALYTPESILVNRENLLDSDYEPQDQVKVTVRCATSEAVYLERVAAEALGDMFVAATESGYTLYLKSGYRPYGTQKSMYANRLQSMNGKDDKVVAPPGASEHQTGLGCDILNKDYAGRPRMTPDFSETAEARWLAENCMAFGFILRYPEDKTDITQIIFEPWHFRYVGREIAGYIMRNGLTLEEFTDQWRAAVAEFEGRGGSVEEQIAYERNRRSMGPASSVLDLYGEDGDAEVSLSF